MELAFKIYTLDWPELSDSANLIVEQWKKIGANAEVVILTVSDLQQNYLRPREYDSILIGQDIGFNSDPYSYWHSSQRDDPGLNLALFKNDKADSLLDDARQQQDAQKRLDDYKEFQKIIAEEIPAIFLFSNSYLYPTSNEVKGIEVRDINTPAGRFSDVAKWYVKTKRVLK
jgi:peptide/nickel transport system substrate-binding protein